jgi:hypothetical protein
MASKYTHEQLVQKLDKPGWRAVTGNESTPHEGSLRTLVEAAHARRAKGQTGGLLREIVTEIEVDMVQLQELWHHLGLPV